MRENSSSSDEATSSQATAAMKHDLMVIRDVHCSTCSKLLGDDIITLPIKYVPERKFIKENRKVFIRSKSTRLNGRVQNGKEDFAYYVKHDLSNSPPICEGKFCSYDCAQKFYMLRADDVKYRDAPILLYLQSLNSSQ